MKLRRRARALIELHARLESGGVAATDEEMLSPVYDQVGPSSFEWVRSSVWGQVHAVYDPDADPDDIDVYADPRLPGGIRHE